MPYICIPGTIDSSGVGGSEARPTTGDDPGAGTAATLGRLDSAVGGDPAVSKSYERK